MIQQGIQFGIGFSIGIIIIWGALTIFWYITKE